MSDATPDEPTWSCGERLAMEHLGPDLGCTWPDEHNPDGWHTTGDLWWRRIGPQGMPEVQNFPPLATGGIVRQPIPAELDPPECLVPLLARVDLDAVRERLAEVRAGRRLPPRGLAGAADPHHSLANVCAFSARDWARDREDAWIYGIVMGWSEALDEVGEQHGWTPEARTRLADLHRQFAELDDLRSQSAANFAMAKRTVERRGRMLEELRAELARVRDAPAATWHADGTIDVRWSEGQTSCLMSRQVLDSLLSQLGIARAEVEQLRAERDDTRAILDGAGVEVKRLRGLVGDAIDAGARNDGEDIARIWREAGLT